MRHKRKKVLLFCMLCGFVFLTSCGIAKEVSPSSPENPAAFVAKGVLYLREFDAGSYDVLKKAAAAFEIAAQMNSDLPEVQDGLGCVALREGRVDASESFFNRAILIDPSYARAWVNKAYVAELRGEKEQANEFLRTALEVNPFEVHGLTNLAGILIDQKPREEAVKKEIQSLIYRAHELSGGQSDIVERNVNLSAENH